jgi:histidine triad (HIT) family protein
MEEGHKEDCIFCKIATGKIPCAKVYENEHVLAFLDIAPVNKGHTLVIPKKHSVNLLDIPDAELKEVMAAAKKVANAVKIGTKCDGISLSMSNGKAAGQEVGHAHVHIIPRFSYDGLRHWPHKMYQNGEMIDTCERITQRLR